jgi:beta-lactamase superfamily II metal-dependent hydrolase
MYNIHMLPASFGDAILIEYGPEGKPSYILIDGGPYFNFAEMIKGLKRVAPKLTKLELLVITHVDIDHIDGIVTLLNQHELPFTVNEIWFNGFRQLERIESDVQGALQGEYLSTLISKNKLKHNTYFRGGPVMVHDFSDLPEIRFNDFVITLLSPGERHLEKLRSLWKKEIAELESEKTIEQRWKEDKRYDDEISDILGKSTIRELQEAKPKGDKSVANQSSIAFIGTYENKRCLFAGDATTDNLLEAVPSLIKPGAKRLKLNAWKVAHHGSKGSTLDALMEKIDCKTILVSSDGKRYQHPDPECIAKLIKHTDAEVSFYFNYLTEFTRPWNNKVWKDKYHFHSFYPDDSPGITISL